VFEKQMPKMTVVISDYKMPGMDGLETLTTIGRMKPSVTRIILTGYATVKAAISATNEGIDGFLTKPFDNIELRQNIFEISLRKHLREFVSEPVYRQICRSRGTIEPVNQEVTVLFADIRGFTRISARVAPKKLVDFLNESYFGPMGEIASRNGGTLDKHIGDSLMIVFGAPFTAPDDTDRAVHAALEMQEEAHRIDHGLCKESGLELKIGIGIATGPVFCGILGSRRKREYTSIGRAVNMASRLQQVAGPGEIYLCSETFRRVKNQISAKKIGPMVIKGLDLPACAYRLSFESKVPCEIANR
jgi:adenylate cyclase